MIFKQFSPNNIIIDQMVVTSSGLWRNGQTEWSSFFTSSRQSTKSSSLYSPLCGLYYLDVYDGSPSESLSDVCFSLAYGNYNGLGSSTYDISTGSLYPTKVVYTEHSNILLSPGDTKFTFTTSSNFSDHNTIDSDDIYVINYRNFMEKDGIVPGKFEMSLVGSDGTITLIDDSIDNPSTTLETNGKRYNLIRGSISSGPINSGRCEAIGLIYPNIGIVVLNPTVISRMIGTVGGLSLNDPVTQWSGKFESMPSILFKAISDGSQLYGKSMKITVADFVDSRRYIAVAEQ